MTAYKNALRNLVDEYCYEFDKDDTGSIDNVDAAMRAWNMSARIIADIFGKSPNEVKCDAAAYIIAAK